MSSEVSDPQTEQESLDLDPFAFIPEASSRVPGLGGPMPPADPTYAFHTPYVAVARGTVNFNVQFHNIQARRGTLALRVHMLPDEPGSIARLVNSERIQLNRLVAQGGHVSIATEGFRGVTYALVGAIPDATDVTADGLSIRLDRKQDSHEQRAALVDVRSTKYGNARLRPSPHILAMVEPRFAEPVSQPFTESQLTEVGFVARLGGAAALPLDPATRWELGYALQVFSSYGMLADGARGLGLITGPTALPALAAAAGPSVHAVVQDGCALAADRGEAILDALEYPAVCDSAVARQRITASIADPFRLPHEIVNLDFLWTDHLCDQLDVGGTIGFLDEVIDRLRPGGLSVHLLTADMSVSGRGGVVDGCAVYGRGDIERLALTLISRGHEIARVRPGGVPHQARGATVRPLGPTSFGLLVRRARSAI